MDQITYNEIAESLVKNASHIEWSKRPAYTMGNSDVLHNFKSVAERLGITPMQAWGVYMLKHIDAITAYAKDNSIPQAEALIGRFSDALNYMKLGYALYKEQEQLKS